MDTATLAALLIFFQGLGAFTGAVAVAWGEWAYARAMRDGRVDRAERVHLDAIARGLRWGMTLLLLATFALVILAYASGGPQPALMADFWALVVIAAVIIYVSWALSRKRLSFNAGSAIAFAGWWFVAYLVLGKMPGLSFGASIAFFVVSAVIFYYVLRYARMLSVAKR